jgi:hypothetical protein
MNEWMDGWGGLGQDVHDFDGFVDLSFGLGINTLTFGPTLISPAL